MQARSVLREQRGADLSWGCVGERRLHVGDGHVRRCRMVTLPGPMRTSRGDTASSLELCDVRPGHDLDLNVDQLLDRLTLGCLDGLFDGGATEDLRLLSDGRGHRARGRP